MGLAYNTGAIISGLVLCVDGANLRSWAGSGTTWFDVSGNNNTNTLTNGPTYSATFRRRIC